MVLEIVIIIVSIAVVLWGADRFTDGASGLARRLNVSELVIGLTVVALGTSLPEFMVCFMSVLRASSDMSVGNILGSNIFNILVILGASALMRPLKIESSLLKRDLPLCLAATLMLVFFSLTPFSSVGEDGNAASTLPSLAGGGGGIIARWEGLLLVAFFCVYLYVAYRVAQKDRKTASSDSSKEGGASLWSSVLLILIGMVALVLGGRFLVDNAAAVAKELHVSESVIGLTILAGGTSLPELATSVVAARKGSLGLAFGNVIGSNVFNIAFVIGTCSSIVPMEVTQITMIDWAMFVGSCVLVWLVAWSRRTINFMEGLLLVLCYMTYLTWLIIK